MGVLCSQVLFAQMGYRIGYNACMFGENRNLQIPVYEFNRTHPDIDSKLEVPLMGRGIAMGVDIGTHGGIEILYTGKRARSVVNYQISGIDSVAELRFVVNSWGFGAFFPVAEDHFFGVNFDMGNLKIQKKRCPADSVVVENMFEKEMVLGFTTYFNLHLALSDGFSFNIRPQYQLIWPISYPSFDSNDYYIKLNNAGISVTILIGKGGN